jgi:hypothetical protein
MANHQRPFPHVASPFWPLTCPSPQSPDFPRTEVPPVRPVPEPSPRRDGSGKLDPETRRNHPGPLMIAAPEAPGAFKFLG